MNRRSFIKNAAGLLVCAPMVVRAESLMKITLPQHQLLLGTTFTDALDELNDHIEVRLHGMLYGIQRNKRETYASFRSRIVSRMEESGGTSSILYLS